MVWLPKHIMCYGPQGHSYLHGFHRFWDVIDLIKVCVSRINQSWCFSQFCSTLARNVLKLCLDQWHFLLFFFSIVI